MESQIVSVVGNFISTVGFPVFVAVYVLCRMEPTIKELQKTVTVLTVVVARSNGVDYQQAKEMVSSSGNGKCK